jgi:hypothetical protein
VKTGTPAPHAGETEAPAIPRAGKTPGMGAPPRQSGEAGAVDPSELDDPTAANPDREPGGDHPRQRPITDNKAGG